jgi:hypothetical protein
MYTWNVTEWQPTTTEVAKFVGDGQLGEVCNTVVSKLLGTRAKSRETNVGGPHYQ